MTHGFDEGRLARIDKHFSGLPSGSHPIRPQFRQLVYSALLR